MARERGRPRNFNEETALDSALAVFWKHGFQGASVAELTSVMGLSKPSLYASFGNKETLYLKALERYMVLRIAQHVAILNNEQDGRRAVKRFLQSMAAMHTESALPGGCFIINGTADCGGLAVPKAVELALREALQGCEDQLLQRIKQAQRDGHLAKKANVVAMTALFLSLMAGMAVLAKGGAKQAKLNAAIDAAMAVWPMSPVSNTEVDPVLRTA